MNRVEPLLISEATVGLYPADADGLPISGLEVFAGGFAEDVALNEEFQTYELTPTGSRYPGRGQIPMGHTIRMARLSGVSRNNLDVFDPDPGQKYVLVLHWQTPTLWHKRTYFGVTCLGSPMQAAGMNELREQQGFFAERMAKESGYGDYAPAAVETADVDQVYFGKISAAASGQYLNGGYVWPTLRTPNKVKAIGLAGQTASTVLTLEVNGALTAATLTLLTGADGAEVSAEAAITGITIPAGQGVRWKVTGAPTVQADQMTEIALVMRVG